MRISRNPGGVEVRRLGCSGENHGWARMNTNEHGWKRMRVVAGWPVVLGVSNREWTPMDANFGTADSFFPCWRVGAASRRRLTWVSGDSRRLASIRGCWFFSAPPRLLRISSVSLVSLCFQSPRAAPQQGCWHGAAAGCAQSGSPAAGAGFQNEGGLPWPWFPLAKSGRDS
jgi:hypothetical protein